MPCEEDIFFDLPDPDPEDMPYPDAYELVWADQGYDSIQSDGNQNYELMHGDLVVAEAEVHAVELREMTHNPNSDSVAIADTGDSVKLDLGVCGSLIEDYRKDNKNDADLECSETVKDYRNNNDGVKGVSVENGGQVSLPNNRSDKVTTCTDGQSNSKVRKHKTS